MEGKFFFFFEVFRRGKGGVVSKVRGTIRENEIDWSREWKGS